MSVDALFLSPHPDDVELFCGGTVARLSRQGRRVAILDLTAGELGSNGTVEQRRSESLAAAAALGAERAAPLGLPDGGLHAGDPDQLRAVIEAIRSLRPALCVAPWREDRHPDHEAAAELARRACFLAGLRRFDAAGEPHRPARLLHYPCHLEVPVQLVVDVGATLDAWEAAIACYPSQFTRAGATVPTPINEPSFLAELRARRRRWGRETGVAHGEGFVLAGPWLDDPRDWFDRTEASS